MKKEDFKSKYKSLYEKYFNDVSELNKQYALENSKYKVGDIVTDHIGSIKIEKIRISGISSFTHPTKISETDMPYCIYNGIEVKKDGTPKKHIREREVYQSNIKK